MTIAYWTGWEGYAIILPIFVGGAAWYLINEMNKKSQADTLNEQYNKIKHNRKQ